MSNWDLSKAIGHQLSSYEVTVDSREIILYALGIGFQKDPLNKEHYNFSYENAEDFQAFPTIAVVLAHRNGSGLISIPGVPEYNPMMLLHGEEKVEILSPIQPDSTLVVKEFVHDLQDKGKATVLVVRSELRDKATDELKARIYMNAFVRGLAGSGNKGTFSNPLPNAPKTAPTNSVENPTDKNQAFFYRLCGDRNPLHVDPAMSEMGGFKVPILHGLCTYGTTARSIYETYFKGNASQLASISGRFTSHVFPGETLIVNSWKDGDTIVFETTTKERGLVVLKGYATLRPQAKL